MILGEQTGTGPHIDYIPDALGSVVAAVDQNLVTTYTAAYSPFGDVIASTGTAPNLTWVGTLGYLQSAGRPFAEYSVRNRIYSSTTGRWTSVDPYWPTEPPYGYVDGSPTLFVDPSGLARNSCPNKPGYDLTGTCSGAWSIVGTLNQCGADDNSVQCSLACLAVNVKINESGPGDCSTSCKSPKIKVGCVSHTEHINRLKAWAVANCNCTCREVADLSATICYCCSKSKKK